MPIYNINLIGYFIIQLFKKYKYVEAIMAKYSFRVDKI